MSQRNIETIIIFQCIYFSVSHFQNSEPIQPNYLVLPVLHYTKWVSFHTAKIGDNHSTFYT